MKFAPKIEFSDARSSLISNIQLKKRVKVVIKKNSI